MTSNPLTNIAVHCTSEQDKISVLSELETLNPNLRWVSSGRKPTEFKSRREQVFFVVKDDMLWLGSEQYGETVLSASEFLSTYGGKSVEDANLTQSDCRTEEGITIGLIDSIISTCRALVPRLQEYPGENTPVHEALKDLRKDEDLFFILKAHYFNPRIHGEEDEKLMEMIRKTAEQLKDKGILKDSSPVTSASPSAEKSVIDWGKIEDKIGSLIWGNVTISHLRGQIDGRDDAKESIMDYLKREFKEEQQKQK